MKNVPKLAKIDLLFNHSCFVDEKSKVCPGHLQGNRLKPNVVVCSSNKGSNKTTLSSQSSSVLISRLIEVIKLERESPYLDFSDPNLTVEDFYVWTGWTKEQMFAMHQVFRKCKIQKKNTKHLHTSLDVLAMFWIKVKTNLSFNQIASLFNIFNKRMHGRLPRFPLRCYTA